MKIKRLIVYLSLCVVILLNISCGSTIDSTIETEERIEYEYIVTTIAGSDQAGHNDDVGESAQFNYPTGSGAKSAE